MATGPAPQGILLRQCHHAFVGAGQKNDCGWPLFVLVVPVVFQPQYPPYVPMRNSDILSLPYSEVTYQARAEPGGVTQDTPGARKASNRQR